MGQKMRCDEPCFLSAMAHSGENCPKELSGLKRTFREATWNASEYFRVRSGGSWPSATSASRRWHGTSLMSGIVGALRKPFAPRSRTLKGIFSGTQRKMQGLYSLLARMEPG